MMKSPRQEKIAEEIRREVSQAILFRVSDPQLQGVSVTNVKMTPDLRLARVYFTVPSDPTKGKDVAQALKKHAHTFKDCLAKNLRLKYIPNFEFFYDESLELQDRIDALFQEVERKRSGS